jgi:hypothetical protein
MKIKLISVGIGLVFLLMVFPNVASEDYRYEFRDFPDHYFHGSIWLYPSENITTGENGLSFYPNIQYIYDRDFFNDDFFPPLDPIDISDEDFRLMDELVIEENEVLNLTISNVSGRLYNPEIETRLTMGYWNYWYSGVECNFRLKCDGDGDGIFEYTAIFPENPQYGNEIEPVTEIGEPNDMTNGTILLEISNSGHNTVEISNDVTNDFMGNDMNTYIQVPFNIDYDSDGIGDYTDSDDDNDGYSDQDDEFPINPKEWRDSDGDGIGDNQDRDDNGNGIPDDLELPLALCILLIPILVIFFILRFHKKKSGSKKGGDEEAPQITDPRSGLKNW